jgi:fumigallin biosynthesis monooxygenase-like protein
MKTQVDRRTVDLSAFPNLVVIYLGMRVNVLRGVRTLMGLGPQVESAGGTRPDGLLHYENNIIFSLFPLHVGMRWYWRDFDSLERWSRSDVHKKWWQDFLKDSGGTGFWHETYFMEGGMEAIYDDLKTARVGLSGFAHLVPARGRMFSARSRNKLQGEAIAAPQGLAESDIYTQD